MAPNAALCPAPATPFRSRSAPNAAMWPALARAENRAQGPERGDSSGGGGRLARAPGMNGDRTLLHRQGPLNAVVVPCLTSLPNARLERRGPGRLLGAANLDSTKERTGHRPLEAHGSAAGPRVELDSRE